MIDEIIFWYDVLFLVRRFVFAVRILARGLCPVYPFYYDFIGYSGSIYETPFWACLHVPDILPNLVDGLAITTNSVHPCEYSCVSLL